MKIIKNIFYIVLLCAMLLCVMIFVPLTRQINSDYNVTLYDLDSNEELQYMKAHVFGSYEYYLFHINSNCRFEGYIEITVDNDEVKLYENVIIDLNNGIGAMCCIDERGTISIVGNFTETLNPVKSGKIILSQPYRDCYAVYEK